MTLGSHQRCVGKSQSHFTPRYILDALGKFDLDPCAGDPRPWDCASTNFTERTNGLSRNWGGRVFLNPPFDRYKVSRWIEKLARHGNGIALVHARTETDWFEPIWAYATGILFLADRIHFCDANGREQRANSGAPAVLVSFDAENLAVLERCGLDGFLTTTWRKVGDVGKLNPRPTHTKGHGERDALRASPYRAISNSMSSSKP